MSVTLDRVTDEPTDPTPDDQMAAILRAVTASIEQADMIRTELRAEIAEAKRATLADTDRILTTIAESERRTLTTIAESERRTLTAVAGVRRDTREIMASLTTVRNFADDLDRRLTAVESSR